MKIILKQKFGGFDRIERVFAFDPDRGNALCLMRDYGGASYLAEVQVGDVQAVRDDAAGTFEDAGQVLRQRAGFIIPSSN